MTVTKRARVSRSNQERGSGVKGSPSISANRLLYVGNS